MTTFVPVVDLSHSQGPTDFQRMRATGVQGLIIRVSNGTMIDDLFEIYWNDARAAGYEETDLATYTFINPKRGTPQEAAQATLGEIDRVVGHTRVGYMVDAESYAAEFPNPGQAPIHGAAMAAHLRAHLAVVRAAGARDFAYSNRSYWNGQATPTDEWVGDDTLAAELDFIVARYPAHSDAAYAHYGYPPDPDGWHDWAFKAQPQGPLPPRGGSWLGWQVSAGWNRQGAKYGVSSRDLDLNVIHPDAWARWTGKTNPPPPSEDDMLELITNDIYPNPGYSVWALMDDGSKRGVSPAEYTARGVRVPRIVADADLALIPDYVAGGFNPAALNALNDAVGRLGQNQGSAALELERAAAALKGV